MTAAARDRDEAGARPVARLPAERARAAALALEARAPATRRAYRAALERLDATLAGRPLSDATLAEHVFRLAADGLAPASIAQAAAAAAFLARIAGWPNPRGPMTADALRIVKRDHADRARGQARPVGAEDVAAIVATARRDGRDRDAAIAGVLFQAALRRSEAPRSNGAISSRPPTSRARSGSGSAAPRPTRPATKAISAWSRTGPQTRWPRSGPQTPIPVPGCSAVSTASPSAAASPRQPAPPASRG